MPRLKKPPFIIAPFTVIVDTREGHPFGFTGLRSNSKDKYKPIIVPTEVATLSTGDYSIDGFEDAISVERKSLDDAFGTFGAGRERFERELERLSQMDFAAVVIEADWKAIFESERPVSKLGRSFTADSFRNSVVSWQIRFPSIQWWTCPTRWFAEEVTFRLLDRYYRKKESDTEKAFQKAISNDPSDDLIKQAYADWLEENGRARQANKVRKLVVQS